MRQLDALRRLAWTTPGSGMEACALFAVCAAKQLVAHAVTAICMRCVCVCGGIVVVNVVNVHNVRTTVCWAGLIVQLYSLCMTHAHNIIIAVCGSNTK